VTLEPGAMLTDNLQLERELGAGGMGSVWLARNCALGSEVAVKVLHQGGARTAAQRQRFEQEARGLARLDHPNLVKILDFGLSGDGEPFIVMEVLRGEDLARRLDRERPLPLALTVHIVGQVCRALQHAHAAGVVHRDIKPANVFLTEHDGEVYVKVLDFGIARFNEGVTDATRTGVLLGTPAFMSPEQLLSPKSVDLRSDTWALGVLVYACVTGRLPFEGETVTALGIAVVQSRPVAPTQLDPRLPSAIDYFIERALARDPAQRFQSARELGEALRAASQAPLRVATPGPATMPIAPVALPAPPPRRTGLGVALAVGLGGLLVGGTALAVFLATSPAAPDNEDGEEAPKPRTRAKSAPAVSSPPAPGSVVPVPVAPPPPTAAPSYAIVGEQCQPGNPCVCELPSACTRTCVGMGCLMRCKGVGACTFHCPEGSCVVSAENVGRTELFCQGGDCRFRCRGPGACRLFECPDCNLACSMKDCEKG
jgi:predicted Ser/Thr protein kinase